MSEAVMVFPTDVLHRKGIYFQGFTHKASLLQDLCNYCFFLKRDIAETNPDYKQIIPYAVLKYGNTYYRYRRGVKSGEDRLKAKLSIGFGGHVEIKDFNEAFMFGQNPYYPTIYRCAHREVSEEVSLTGHGGQFQLVGLVNDDSTEVGKVHFGAIFCFELTVPEVTIREESIITELELCPLDELRAKADQMESWSQLVLKGLNPL